MSLESKSKTALEEYVQLWQKSNQKIIEANKILNQWGKGTTKTFKFDCPQCELTFNEWFNLLKKTLAGENTKP